MEEIYNAYFNAFLNAALQKLKPGFGTVITFYPYLKGCVMKVEMKTNTAHNKVNKSFSSDIGEALAKTTLFDKVACKRLADRTVSGTLILITSINEYVIIKSNEISEWTDEKAVADFSDIVVKVKSLYGSK